jgi:hypothetical protein
MLRALFAMLAPYRVSVNWDGDLYVHMAHTRKDVLEWVACYPAHAHIVVSGRNVVVAQRAPA